MTEPERTSSSQGRQIATVQLGKLLLRLISAALLARLLTPAAYGLQGMAAAVFGFLYMARDLGIVTALQQPGVTPITFNALCRVGVVGGAALALLCAALALPAGWFFGESSRVPAVLAAMGISFVFSGASAPALGLLYREQRAATVARLDLAALLVASILAVAAGWAGGEVWALVLLSVTHEAALCGFAWWSCPWRPGRDVRGAPWRTLVSGGAHLTGHQIVNYVRSILDQVVVGRSIGADALGLYGRGAQIAALPAQFALGPFSPWVLANLGRLRDRPEEFGREFRHTLNGLLHAAFAAAAVCIALPALVITLLFGSAWIEAAPVTRWLGVALAFQPWLLAAQWVLSVHGHTRRLFYWSAAGAAVTAAACLSAAPFGAAAIAASAAIATVVPVFAAPFVCRPLGGLQLGAWLHPAVTPLCLHGGLAVILVLNQRVTPPQTPVALQAGAALALMVIYYGGAILTFPGVRAELHRHPFWSR